MIKQTLQKARKYEEVYERRISKEERPDFHLSPRIGWMNDPNGFSYYQGKYHMFFQYHPYDSKWGPMHWGHAVSEDLLHWEPLPTALAPDFLYDQDGCFSGNAIELPDGRQLLMYTGVLKIPLPGECYRELQTQCIAVGDGVDYEKYENNPVLNASDLPEGGSEVDFRDPKLWRREDGTYRCIAGNRAADGSGQILLFESEDCFHWKFKKKLIENKNRFGRMWECPDFFSLDGRQVLLVSPQDMLPKDFEYHNGNGTLCLIGSWDDETETFTEEFDQSVDYGIDFYAPQTVLAPDGRRIMIGWMQNWDTILHEEHIPWFGQMSIPREISIQNNRLYQKPIRELESLRSEKVEYQDVLLEQDLTLPGIEGRRIDLELEIAPAEGEELYRKFIMNFAEDENFHTSFIYKPRTELLQIDRKFSGSRRAFIHQRRSKLPGSSNGKLKLRMILDRFSVEIFVNDGQQALSATLDTEQCADKISFHIEGKAKLNLVKYNLNA